MSLPTSPEFTELLSIGDSVYFRADVPHSYENRTAREIRCLDVIRYVRGT